MLQLLGKQSLPLLSLAWLVAWKVLLGLVLSLTALIVAFLLHRFLSWWTSPLRKLPGPKSRGSPWHNFVAIRSEPYLQPFYRWWKDAVDKQNGFKNVHLVHYNMVFWRQALLVLDKDIVKAILTSPFGKDPPRFTKRTQFIQDTVGNGLVTVQGAEWARHRRLLQPSFNTQFLRQSMTQAVPSRVQRLIRCWKRAAQEGWELDIASHLASLTLDIVGQVAFSHEFNALQALETWAEQHQKGDKDKWSEYGDQHNDELLRSFQQSLRINFMTVFCVLVGLEKLNWYINPQVRSTSRMLDRAVESVVAKARKETTAKRSLLHILLEAKYEEDEDDNDSRSKETKEADSDDKEKPLLPKPLFQLSESDIRDEVKTFMIAGYETTSAWLRWAIFALTQHDGVQERLIQEIRQHAPADRDQDITLEHTDQMEYLGAFLQEVLRFYPPVGLFIRYNAFAEQWHGITIPPDTRLVLSPHLLGRHPEYWDEPDRFWPERWINVPQNEAERRRFAFIPFSAGGRNCIGQHFATMEAKLILAHLLREYEFSLAPSLKDATFVVSLTGVTAQTKPALKVTVATRQ